MSASITAIFTEVETGNLNARPELVKALHVAKVTGATLVIKLDRLSRNAAFLITLQDADVKFVAVDLPHANNLTIGTMALVAQQEAEAISKRTKEALDAAKRRGKVLGNPNGAAALLKAAKGSTALISVSKTKADLHAANLQPVIDSLKWEGIISLSGIAKAFNERGMLTPRGGIWHKTSVLNMLARISR
jgi:DNA invertase Pin-like site-specific DNA recombinase